MTLYVRTPTLRILTNFGNNVYISQAEFCHITFLVRTYMEFASLLRLHVPMYRGVIMHSMHEREQLHTGASWRSQKRLL